MPPSTAIGRNRWVLVTTVSILFFVLLYMTIASHLFDTDETSAEIVTERSSRREIEHGARTDDSIKDPPVSRSARVKRAASRCSKRKALPGTEVVESSQQMLTTPMLPYFYGLPQQPPETMASYQMAGQQQFVPAYVAQNQAGSTPLDPAFFPAYQQQQQQQPPSFPQPLQQQQQQQQLTAPQFLAEQYGFAAMQPMCFPTQENWLYASAVPFYCVYVPVPTTYQFPVVSGFADFAGGAGLQVAQNGFAAGEQAGSARAEIIPYPFQQYFADLGPNCPSGQYPCRDGSRCIATQKRCDNRVDCKDASDEDSCTCRERIDKERLCDDYQDCPQGEDELGCFGCPNNSFSCSDETDTLNGNDNCISPEKRCDGIRQCANGKDEDGCIVVTESYITKHEMYPVSYNIGFLYKNWRGQWFPVCGQATIWAKEACTAEEEFMSDEPQLELVTVSNHREVGPYLTDDGYYGKLTTECSDQIAYVNCPLPVGRARSGPFLVNRAVAAPPRTGLGDVALGRDNATDDPLLSIVGGHDSSPRAWPFIIAINKNGHFHCGGAVLNEWWILSAAHCFNNYQKHYYEIEGGALRRRSYSPTRQIRQIDGVIIHQNYDTATMRNDIALAVLDEGLYFNKWVQPVVLPEPSTEFFSWGQRPSPGDICIAVGWGASKEGGSDIDHLREVEVPIIYCRHPEDINRAEICAGYTQGGKDACQGDSGGPLMCRARNSVYEWYIGGIVSHGVGCGRRNEPGAYTKVSHFVNWINRAMSKGRHASSSVRPRSSCPGFSCKKPHAHCIPGKRRCDRVVDCLEAEDEQGCPYSEETRALGETGRSWETTPLVPTSVR